MQGRGHYGNCVVGQQRNHELVEAIVLDAHKVVKQFIVFHISGVEVEREHGLDDGFKPGCACLGDLDGLAVVHPNHDDAHVVRGDRRLVHERGEHKGVRIHDHLGLDVKLVDADLVEGIGDS